MFSWKAEIVCTEAYSFKPTMVYSAFELCIFLIYLEPDRLLYKLSLSLISLTTATSIWCINLRAKAIITKSSFTKPHLIIELNFSESLSLQPFLASAIILLMKTHVLTIDFLTQSSLYKIISINLIQVIILDLVWYLIALIPTCFAPSRQSQANIVQ